MSFLNSGLASVDKTFNLRVQAAIVKIAMVVVKEADTVPNHERRNKLALAVLANPPLVATRFAWACAMNQGISDSVTVSSEGAVDVTATDADIETVCTNFWNPIANFGR